MKLSSTQVSDTSFYVKPYHDRFFCKRFIDKDLYKGLN